MPTSDFLPFATDPGANVITQGAWAALLARAGGFQAGVAQSDQLNKAWRQASVMAAVLGQFINDYGALDALDDGNVANLVRDFARSIQAGKFAYVVATGTANVWAVAPTPAVAAYAAGRALWIRAPATNTQSYVVANVSELGDRVIKKSNGSALEARDLVSGQVYPTIDDGANIRVVVPLPSDRLVQPYLGFHGDPITQSFANNTQARVASYSSVVNNLPGASHSGGIITVGTTGRYAVTANMLALMPGSGGSNYFYAVTASKVDGAGVPLASIAAQPVTVTPASIAANLAGAATGIAMLTAGDRIAAFFVHNQGSSLNMSISLDVEFRGA